MPAWDDRDQRHEPTAVEAALAAEVAELRQRVAELASYRHRQACDLAETLYGAVVEERANGAREAWAELGLLMGWAPAVDVEARHAETLRAAREGLREAMTELANDPHEPAFAREMATAAVEQLEQSTFYERLTRIDAPEGFYLPEHGEHNHDDPKPRDVTLQGDRPACACPACLRWWQWSALAPAVPTTDERREDQRIKAFAPDGPIQVEDFEQPPEDAVLDFTRPGFR